MDTAVIIVAIILVLVVVAVAYQYWWVPKNATPQTSTHIGAASVLPSGSATGTGNGTATTTTNPAAGTPTQKIATSGATPTNSTPVTNPAAPTVAKVLTNQYLQINGQYLVLQNNQPITLTSDVSQATPIKVTPIPTTSTDNNATGGGSYILTPSGQYISFAQISPSSNLTLPGQGVVMYSPTFLIQHTTKASMYISNSWTSNIAFLFASGYYFLAGNSSGYYVNPNHIADTVSIVAVAG